MNQPFKHYRSPLDLHSGKVDITHGGGGRAMMQLIDELFAHHFDNQLLRQGNDFAQFDAPPGRLVVSTDGHVVSPLFFPGGDIGSLAVHGTINDIAMAGAKPLYLCAGFILEEGFPLSELQQIIISMAAAAQQAGTPVIAGDTKVVQRGKGDGVFITTTGIGVVPDAIAIAGNRAKAGDLILINGSIGDHGIAVMSGRENLHFASTIESDSAALHTLVADMISATPDIHCLRDPTRGGLAATLNELAQQSAVGIKIRETAIPIKAAVKAACEIMGLDPLYIANEGKLVCICDADDAERLLAVMKTHPLGREAAIIGEVIEDPQCTVHMQTAFNSHRIVDWLAAEQLPRIC